MNASANDIAVPPFLEAGRPNDTNNYQPRVGFAYQLTDRTVMRGGSGLYFYEPITSDTLWTVGNSLAAIIQVTNDGRPNFAADPFNGRPLPTFEQAQVLFCHVNRAPGCLQSSLTELVSPLEYSASSGPHLAELDRLCTPNRQHDGLRGGLCLHTGAQREGHHR